MSGPSEVQSPGRRSDSRERLGVLGIAVLVIGGIGAYLFLRTSGGADSRQNLLPYQVLLRTLPETEQQTYLALREGLLYAEADRARLARWPSAHALASHGIAPFAPSPGGLRWQDYSQGATVNYVGIPADPSAPAWLLVVQEPEPGDPPDPSPLDDEHHQLPDGTTLHIYVWMHQYGGRVAPGFAPQPQAAGWIQVFSTPPNPVLTTGS